MRTRHRLIPELLAVLLCFGTLAVRAADQVSGPYGFRPEKLADMDTTITEAIAEKNCPGGVLWLERNGSLYHKAYGERSVAPRHEPMTEDTIFDAASLTKVLATTPAIMLLAERGLVNIDAPAQLYLPEFHHGGAEAITVRQLLTHTSGL